MFAVQYTLKLPSRRSHLCRTCTAVVVYPTVTQRRRWKPIITTAGADDGSRTHNPQSAGDFKSHMYTNSITSAYIKQGIGHAPIQQKPICFVFAFLPCSYREESGQNNQWFPASIANRLSLCLLAFVGGVDRTWTCTPLFVATRRLAGDYLTN